MTLRRALIGYIAGFVATVTAHQGALGFLYWLGWTDHVPFALQGTPPFGVSQVISSAVWAGIWGVVMGAALPRTLHHVSYIAAGAVFGALLPMAVQLLVVLPLKAQPMAGAETCTCSLSV